MSIDTPLESASLVQLQQTPIDNVLHIIDEGLVHLPTYRELYYRWERQQWQSQEIDFRVDQGQWAQMSEQERADRINGLAAFFQGATLPNREYMHAAQSYGETDNNLPGAPGFPDTTIFAALSRAGVSNRYFFNDVPVSALWGAPGLARSGPISEYYERCANGTLPHVSYVDPNFAGSEGEGPGLSGDEHPHGDVRTGQAFMSDVVHAFMESPQWRRGALFIVYDEWGGFFDHVRPPRVPDMRNSRDLAKDYGQMGFRIPALAVSPWVRRHHVAHTTYGFESILKMIEYRFGLKPLNRRDAHAQNIARAFDWRSKPHLNLPDLPRPPEVISLACAGGTPGPELPEVPLPVLHPGAKRQKEHDLMDLVHSGYLARLGFEYRPASAESTFREPHKMRSKHAESLEKVVQGPGAA